MSDESPVNPLPPIVVALALIIFGVELLFQLGHRGILGGAEGVGWRLNAQRDYGFFGQVFAWMRQTGNWPVEHLMRFVTYPFVHVAFTHMLMVIVFLLALGKMVGEVFGTYAVLIIFFGSAVVGALAYGFLVPNDVPLVGGYPAVYGLIGSYTFMMWLSYGHAGESRLRAFQLIGFLLGIQLLFGLIFGANKDWLADLAGFATGFVISFALVPGAIARAIDKMRQR